MLNVVKKVSRSLLTNALETLVFDRLEKVNLSNKYSKLKILGTLLCVLGALTMSIMQSISAPATKKEATLLQSSSTPSNLLFDMKKIIGCIYLIISVLILSSSIVLQVTIVIIK